MSGSADDPASPPPASTMYPKFIFDRRDADEVRLVALVAPRRAGNAGTDPVASVGPGPARGTASGGAAATGRPFVQRPLSRLFLVLRAVGRPFAWSPQENSVSQMGRP